MEQSKNYLLPRLPLLPVSIIAKFLEVSEKLCALAYLNKAWHSFVYSGYAWQELIIERGQRGWRDDIRFFINKFLAKFSQHTLIRRLDFSSLTLPQVMNQEQEFCSWLTKFSFVHHLALYENMNLKTEELNDVLSEADHPAFPNLNSLELDSSASKLLLSPTCDFFENTPALERITINNYRKQGATDLFDYKYETQLKRLSELNQINVIGNFFTSFKNIDSFFKSIPQSCPKVTEISLSKSTLETLLFLLQSQQLHWQNCLTSLTFNPPTNRVQFPSLQLPKFTALKKLHLNECTLFSTEIQNLASRCKGLSILYLENVITETLVIPKHPALRSISILHNSKEFEVKLGQLPNLSSLRVEYNLAKFNLESQIPLKLLSFELQALSETKDRSDNLILIESLTLANSALKQLEISYCQIKKSLSLDKFIFASMASASLSSIALLSTLSHLKRLHTLTFHPRFYNPDQIILIHSFFPQLVKLHLDLNHLVISKGLMNFELKHPYLRRVKISATSPMRDWKRKVQVSLCLGEECNKLQTLEIEELKTTIKQLNLDSPISNLKISTEVGIHSVRQNSMSQVFDFPLMQRLVLLNPSSLQLFPFTQRFRSLRFLQMDGVANFNMKEISEMLRNAVNLETLKIRFYITSLKPQYHKFIVNHAKLRTLILRDGHQHFSEIIIGAKCENLEILEICWFKEVILTQQGKNEMKLLLVETSLIDKQ